MWLLFMTALKWQLTTLFTWSQMWFISLSVRMKVGSCSDNCAHSGDMWEFTGLLSVLIGVVLILLRMNIFF